MSEALYSAGLRPLLAGAAMQRLAPRSLTDIYWRQLRLALVFHTEREREREREWRNRDKEEAEKEKRNGEGEVAL